MLPSNARTLDKIRSQGVLEISHEYDDIINLPAMYLQIGHTCR